MHVDLKNSAVYTDAYHVDASYAGDRYFTINPNHHMNSIQLVITGPSQAGSLFTLDEAEEIALMILIKVKEARDATPD